jgi:hypothetical protein
MSYLAMIAVLSAPTLLAFAALRQMAAERPEPVRAKRRASPTRY